MEKLHPINISLTSYAPKEYFLFFKQIFITNIATIKKLYFATNSVEDLVLLGSDFHSIEEFYLDLDKFCENP